MSADILLTTKGLGVRLEGRQILHDVDFEIARGEIVTLVGPNGSGKSTFLKCLIGAIPLSAGDIRRAKGLRIGYVPQKLALDHALPMPVRRFWGLAAEKAADLDEIAELVGVTPLLDRQMAELSGGQMQRVLLGHAIIGNPDMLILDEAAQGLDQPAVAAFYRLVESLRDQRNCAVLMVSHDLHVVMSASDRVICLNGHICCEGAPTVVSEAPEYRQLFGHGTEGALALYRHVHDHAHDHSQNGADTHSHD